MALNDVYRTNYNLWDFARKSRIPQDQQCAIGKFDNTHGRSSVVAIVAVPMGLAMICSMI